MSTGCQSRPTGDGRQTQDFTSRLSNEILDGIFRRLDLKSLLKARQTCRRWAAVGSAVPHTDPQGRLIVNQLPFRLGPRSDRDQIDADQVSLALQSILPGAGEKVKLLSITWDGWRRSGINETTLELIADFCPNLVSLRLSNVHSWKDGSKVQWNINKFDWARMSQLTQLSEFQLEQTGRAATTDQKFTDDVAHLISTSPLTKLTLRGYQQCPTFTASQLTDLSLRCSHISNAQLKGICRSSSKISTLTLTRPEYLTDFTPISALSNLQQLKVEFAAMSNVHLTRICTGCPQLNRLDLDKCDSLNDFAGLASLRHLKSLTVGRKFNDAQADRVPWDWGLEELRVNCGDFNCDRLTDMGLSTLSLKCAGLKDISLWFCTGVTEVSVQQLVANCHELESVVLSGTSGIRSECLPLLGKCESLRTLMTPYRKDWTPDLLERLQKTRRDNGVTTRLDLHIDNADQLRALPIRWRLAPYIRIQQAPLDFF